MSSSKSESSASESLSHCLDGIMYRPEYKEINQVVKGNVGFKVGAGLEIKMSILLKVSSVAIQTW